MNRQDPLIPSSRSVLVLGGVRSGKSRTAESLVEESGLRPVYVATSCIDPEDSEMQIRIQRHCVRRQGKGWHLVEEAYDLSSVLERYARPDSALLIECLGMWVCNLLLGERNVEKLCADFCSCLKKARGPVICVSSEVGLGLLPEQALGRRFLDALGHVNGAVAQTCSHVFLVVAGQSCLLKPSPTLALSLKD